LWKQYNLTNSNKLISLALVVSFCPVAFSLFEGQINILMFFALVGFLYFQTRKQDFLSGLWAIFLTIKPNTIYLVLLALVLWVFIDRKWKFVLGALTGIIVLVLLTFLLNQHIFAQYLVYMREIRPGDVLNTSFYGWISHLTGKDNQLAFYLPVLVGLVFFAMYGSSRHFRWSWKMNLPVLIMISLITTPYAWVHDEVLFIFPLLQAAGLLLAMDGKKVFKWTFAIIYALLNIAGLILIPRYRYAAYDLLWIPVVFSILYGVIVFVSKLSPNQGLVPEGSAEGANLTAPTP
jgi:hypothetical protein